MAEIGERGSDSGKGMAEIGWMMEIEIGGCCCCRGLPRVITLSILS